MQVTSTNHTENTQHVNFNQLWLKYIVYWPIFLLLLIASIGGAWLYLFYKSPVYEANAQILIKDENKGADDSEALEFLSMISTKKVLENEKEEITSKKIIYRVINKLGLYAPVFEVHKFKQPSAYVTSPINIEARHPNKVKSSGNYNFIFNDEKETVILNNKEYALNQWIVLNNDTFRFSKNLNFTPSHNKNLFFAFVNPRIVAESIKYNIEVVASSKASTILNLKYKDEVPQRAENILNTLIEEYNKASLEDRNLLASNTLAFVEERLKDVEANLDAVETQIKNYKAKSGAVDISTQGGLFLKNVSENDQRLSEINMKLAVLNKVEDYVQTKNSKSGIVPSTLGVEDPMLTRMIGLLYETELNYEKLKNTEGENSPDLLALSQQIEKIRPGIMENIRNQRSSLIASRQNLLSTNNNYISALSSIPQKEKKLVDINREQSIISGIYSFLLQKREEAILSSASQIPNSKLVQKAESTLWPVSPKPFKIYLVAFLFPFVVGIGAITLKETFSSKIQFRHEIEAITAYPIVGEIAYDKSKELLVVSKKARTFISEEFRQLRVALSLNKSKEDCHRILVTSTISGEGKSFVALNLAAMYAYSNKKTVLIELDLNRPTISIKTNISPYPGIAEYLQSKAEKEDIIRRTPISENLFIIPSGLIPDEHPSELLEMGKVQDLLNYLSDIFDYIIIDTSPVSAITDAYVLSSSINVTLYVIRHNYTPKVFIERLDQNNKNNQLNNIAIVFNGIRSRGFGKRKFGYGYGYGYVYNEQAALRTV